MEGTFVAKVLPERCYSNVHEVLKDVLCNVAAFSIFLRPIMAAISMNASTSSLDWNSGNLPMRKKSRIIPAAHMSIATGTIQRHGGMYGGELTSRLIATFEQYFGCSKSSCTRAVGF